VTKSGDNLGTTSIEYRPDKIAGWVPSQWTQKSETAGIPPLIWESTITDFSINYIIRDDGTNRPISPDEEQLNRQAKLNFRDLARVPAVRPGS
jgi:hypothetical protein